MGLKFRKSFKIAPGIKINIGQKSVSITLGKKGYHQTYSTTGKKTTTVGIPGTGIYYTNSESIKNKKRVSNRQEDIRNSGANSNNKPPFYQRTWFIILMLLFIYPVGLLLMWKCTEWNKANKKILTVIFGIFFLYCLIKPNGESNNAVIEKTNGNRCFSKY